jgi:hypothetical protein
LTSQWLGPTVDVVGMAGFGRQSQPRSLFKVIPWSPNMRAGKDAAPRAGGLFPARLLRRLRRRRIFRSFIAAGYRSEMRTFWQQTFASSCRIAFGRSVAIRWRHARTGFLRKADVGSSDVPNFRPRESESVEKGHRKQEEFGKSYRGSKSVQDSLRLRNRPLPKACLTVKAGEHCDQKRNTSAHHCGEGNWSGHHDPLRSQLERRPPGLNKA